MTNIQIVFGALVPSIEEQLKGQGLGYTGNFSEISTSKKHIQRDADAITRLHLRGYLPDSTVKKARKRLMDRIAKCVVEK